MEKDDDKTVPSSDDLQSGSRLQPDLALYHMPGHLIRRLQQIAVSIFLDETKDFGVTQVQLGTLFVIKEVPGLDAMDLSRLIALDRSTVGDVVARLEQRGLVERRRGDSDRRTKLIHLTAAGETLVRDVAEANAAAQTKILACLSDEERASFMWILTKLVALNNQASRAPLKEAVRLQTAE